MGPVLTVDSLLSPLGYRVAFSQVLLVKYGLKRPCTKENDTASCCVMTFVYNRINDDVLTIFVFFIWKELSPECEKNY